MHPRLITLDGAVETAIRLGVADAIADVVETGTTLRQAGLELFGDPILQSEAVLIRRRGAESPIGLDQLQRRLNGVLVARNYVMMDYDVSDEVIDLACTITPGFESPTVAPLAKEGWQAVRVMVPRAEAQQLMDDLWLGARAILVTDIAACRIYVPERAAPGAHRPEPTGGLPIEPTASVRHDRGARSGRPQDRVLGGPTGPTLKPSSLSPRRSPCC